MRQFLKNWFKQNRKSVCGFLAGIFIWVLIKENILELSPDWCYLLFGAIGFDGDDDLIDLGGDASLNISGDLTIAAYIFVNSLADYFYIFGKMGPHLNRGYQLRVDTSGALRGVSYISNVGKTTISTPGDIVTGTWYAVVYTRSSGSQVLYIDGASKGTSSHAGTFDTSSQKASCGRGFSSETGLTFSNGVIGEVVVAAAIWTPTEVYNYSVSRMKYMAQQIQPSYLKGYWPMDDGPDGVSADGDTVRDLSGNGNDGIGDNGTNNTGLIWKAEESLSYPGDGIYITSAVAGIPIPIFDHHYRQMRA